MLHFGVSRRHGGELLEERARAFAQALGASLAEPVGVHVADDYDALRRALRDGRTDLAWMPPLVHERSGQEGFRLAAVPERGGTVGYRAAVLVRRDSAVREISQLGETRAAWVDPSSASGYVVPRQDLSAAGVTFRAESFHGAAHDAARAVTEGRADVCACFVAAKAGDDRARLTLSVANMLGPLAADLRAIHVTAEIPSDALVARDEAHARVTAALLGLHQSLLGLQALQGLLHADRLVAAE